MDLHSQLVKSLRGPSNARRVQDALRGERTVDALVAETGLTRPEVHHALGVLARRSAARRVARGSWTFVGRRRFPGVALAHRDHG